MPMIKQLLGLILILAAATLVACATNPPVALKPEAKQYMRRVAIVEISEPDSYRLYPGAAPGGSALYMFGAIGGAILGGIEASRADAASLEFTTVLKRQKTALANQTVTLIEQGLQAKGYATTRIPVPPKTPDGKDLDYSKIKGPFDAVLIPSLTPGYAADAGVVVPRVLLNVVVKHKLGGDPLFNGNYLYTNREFGWAKTIQAPSKYSLPTIEAAKSPSRAPMIIEAFQDAVTKTTERLVADL